MKEKFVRIIFIAFIACLLGACTTVDKNKQKRLASAKAELRNENVPFSTSGFMEAARKDNEKILNLFLAAGMDINVHDNGTALTYAVYEDNIDSVKFLVAKGADVNESAYWGTPLGIASYKDYDDIAALLVKNGANVNEVSRNGMTPLLNAVLISGRSKIVELLLKNGADPNFEQEQTKETALIIAAGKGYSKIVDLLIKGGADTNYLDSGGLSALDWALLYNHFDVGEIILKNSELINDDEMSSVPMVASLEHKNFKFAELLVKHGANVNRNFGKMPLIVWCAKQKKNDCVKFLVEHGANIHATDKEGSTALDYALRNKDPELIDYLKTLMGMPLTPHPAPKPAPAPKPVPTTPESVPRSKPVVTIPEPVVFTPEPVPAPKPVPTTSESEPIPIPIATPTPTPDTMPPPPTKAGYKGGNGLPTWYVQQLHENR